jgi:putative tricarboxylic transport membrane protein
MEKYDRISAVFWLLFGIFIVVGARNYSFGSLREPGGGLYPSLLGSLLIIMGLLLLAQTRKASGEEGPSWDRRGGGLRRCILTLCGLLVIPFLFNIIGFFPTVFFFILFMMKLILPLPWSTALATSVISTVGGYFLFESWLKIPFPRGFFGL